MPRRPDSPCAGGCGRLLWRGRASLPVGQVICRECRRAATDQLTAPRPCPVCGETYRPTPSHKGRYTTACSRSCADRSRASENPRARRLCEVCGLTYRATYAGQRTCGRECGKGIRRPRARIPAKVYTCGVCGGTRTSGVGSEAWTRYCSNQCRIDSAGLRIADLYATTLSLGLRGGHWLHLLREYLRERDGDRCQICERTIRFDLPSGPKGDPSGLGPSVDHLIPRAHGGGDEAENLRLTHWACNRARGADRGAPTQLALIG
jgi:5-methylcytosine-specific restriction endonuclease McrA